MEGRLERVEVLLRERGLALTPQRRAILRYLAQPGGHWTAGELLGAVTRDLPRASRATVYSTLSLLRELRVLREVACRGGEVRFDFNSDPHHHVLCVRCGRLEDVPLSWFPVHPPVEAQPPFEIERFRVVGEGVCGGCR